MGYPIDPQEELLIRECLANDRLAQQRLYDRYKTAMYTTSYRILTDFEEASDALQEAFIQVFQGLPTFRQQSTLGAWIKTIVVRTSLRRLKRLRFTEQLEEGVYDGVIEWQDGLTGEYLDKAIRELPEGYRSVFVMREVEGYTHKEVGEMLGISEGTSKSQLYRAKRSLQTKLKELMP